MLNIFLYVLLLLFLGGCSGVAQNFAPVINVSVIEQVPKKGSYRVKPSDTLYSIAWRYGMDYRNLAKRNQLSPPYSIYAGQLIYLRVQSQQKNPVPISSPPVNRPKEPSVLVRTWLWPARGRVVGGYNSYNKGINIAGKLGDPIFATASGRVVYSGNGLRRYGNLIIIKHNSNYLTAYAHNNTSYVREGDWVRAGQKIAGMGNNGASRVILHFEIRRNGQSVNPLLYLDRSNSV